MMQGIYSLGEYILNRDGIDLDTPVETLVENANSSDRIKAIFVILLEEKNNTFSYIKIEREEYDNERTIQYLYRNRKGNGTNLSPTAILIDSKKTFQLKILNWFKQFTMKRHYLKQVVSSEFIQKAVQIYNCLLDNSQTILADLDEKSSLLGEDDGSILTVKFLEGDNLKYLGDYPIFQECLIHQWKYNLMQKYKVESRQENQVCSICMKEKAEVFGFVQTYNWYTVDKPGFVPCGFDQRNAWKNYPVCQECAIILEVGKRYIDANLTFNFYGIPYKIIPQFILRKNIGEIIEILEDYQKNIGLRKDDINKLTHDEREILEKLSEQNNFLNCNLLFFREQQSAFRILQLIEDILPSRLRVIYEVKHDIESLEIFRNSPYSKKPIQFNFGIIRKIFPNKKDVYRRDLDNYFLDLTGKIFSGKKVDYHFIIKAIMKEIRTIFLNEPFPIFVFFSLQSLMLILFLKKLKLFKGENKVDDIKETSIIKINETDEFTNRIEDFFQKYSDMFQLFPQKTVFLVGVLTKFLLNIQHNDGKSTPFLSKLQGMKLNEKLIKTIFPEIQNKLTEYRKNYYVKLEAIIAKHFLLSGKNWKMTNDEISFYFQLGMNLSYEFKIKNQNGGNQEDDTNRND